MNYVTMTAPSLHSFWKDLNSLTESVFQGADLSPGFQPRVDVYETEQAYTLEAELPGLGENEVDLRVRDNLLILSRTPAAEGQTPAPERTYHLKERRRLAFERSFHLPVDVDAEHISAVSKNGLLTLTLPRKPETRPRTIPIRSE